MRIVLIIFGVVLILLGLYRMKNNDALFGKSKRSKNIVNLILHGESSGLGQLLSGIACIIIAILTFIIK